LANLLEQGLLYAAAHNSVVGALWKRHHESFRDFILEDDLKSVCEIGAAHGFLAKLIVEHRNVKYFVIEPNPTFQDNRIEVLEGFIEDHVDQLEKYDSIVHSHVLEHVYNPMEFMNTIVSRMGDQTSIYISFPNIEQLIETRGANSLNFEHTYYLHPLNFEWMLSQLGLRIERKEKFEGHSFF
jgi:hypothetical protein